jgi:hypothetical protein
LKVAGGLAPPAFLRTLMLRRPETAMALRQRLLYKQGTEGPWAAEFASAVCGSPKIYASPAPEDDWWGSGDGNKWRGNRSPTHSVNFITAHDGFSLADLVAFNEKHNDANGEQNRRALNCAECLYPLFEFEVRSSERGRGK